MNDKAIINKRFLEVFEELEGRGLITTRAEAARHLGIEPQRMNEILKGRLNVSTAVLTNLFIYYRVDPDYIFLGKPLMFRPPEIKTKKNYPEASYFPIAEEPRPQYSRKKRPVEIQIRHRNQKNEEVIEYISLKELAKELGLTDIEKKLDQLLKRRNQ